MAVVIIGAVGVAGYLWGSGHIRPAPDCCGSGSVGTFMALTPDGAAVTVTAGLFNSSGVDIDVVGGSAELSGATVLSIGPLGVRDPDQFPIPDIGTFPATLPAHESMWFVITFQPDACPETETERQTDWGWVTLDLEAPNSWYPTIGRSYQLDEPLVDGGLGNFSVFSPGSTEDLNGLNDPLAAACALLGR